MPLDLTADCTFTGPALPEPFVKFNLEAELSSLEQLETRKRRLLAIADNLRVWLLG